MTPEFDEVFREAVDETTLGDDMSPAAPELAEGYYLDNFRLIVATVVERYRDLMVDDELGFVERFHACSVDAQRLYVRLISRRGCCFRSDRVSYDEITDIEVASQELMARGLLDSGDDAPADELLALLLRAELDVMARELGVESPDRRRKALVEALLPDNPAFAKPDQVQAETDRVTRYVHEHITVWRTVGHEYLLLLRLLFFGNLEQDWSQFVVRDLGILRFEDYELRRDHRMFPSREAIEHSLELRLARRHIDESFEALKTEPGGLEASHAVARSLLDDEGVLKTWHPVARRHADRVLVKVARQLEREGQLEPALELYGQAESPPARERKVRVLDRLERRDAALELCLTMIEEPRDETEKAFAPRFAHGLRRKLGHTQEKWRRPKRPQGEMSVATPERSVEWSVLATLLDAGKVAVYSENWLWTSLFGLAFWDIVFAPIPGAFQHPFQMGPLDLNGPLFRQRRSAMIEQRLDELRNDPSRQLIDRLWPVYEAKLGTANSLVIWHPELGEALRITMEHLPPPTLALFADRLSRDPRRYRRGLPDLSVFDDSEAGVELLEVKGPGDQLRAEQGAWIDYLNAQGVCASVLRVSYE